MSRYIPDTLKNLVVTRAEYLCEYCLMHEDDAFLAYEIEHIISLKHGDLSDADNLAYACFFCNRHKGSDIASIAISTGKLLRFFNPRTDRWADHFQLSGALITPLTDTGEATVRIFGFNNDERILERETLITIGRYPTPAALLRMQR